MGKNISIYLTDENLKYLDKLCEIWKAGRSESISLLLDQVRRMTPVVMAVMKDQKSPLIDVLRKIVPISGKGDSDD